MENSFSQRLSLLIIFTFLAFQMVDAQVIKLTQIKGTIRDQSSHPVIATVTEKGTKNGTTTDAEGNFNLEASSADAVLVVSGNGIKSIDYRLKGKTSVTIVVERIALEIEVVEVNTGYQRLNRERATGSFEQIDERLLNTQTDRNILKRLDGVVSGLNFNDKADRRKHNMSIRGLSSINGPLDPLIILDNFPYDGNIENINVDDIESVTVLKDAAASSIWGARAANGVIVITTKKARYATSTSIDFNSQFQLQQKTDLWAQPIIESPDYIALEQFLFDKGYFNSTINNSKRNQTPLTPGIDIMLMARDRLISEARRDQMLDSLAQIDSRSDYMKYFYQNPFRQQYTLNLAAGNDRMAYRYSVGYEDRKAERGVESNRLNLRFNNSFRISKGLDLDADVYYTRSLDQGKGKPEYGEMRVNNRAVPYLKLADEQGNALPIYTGLRKEYIEQMEQYDLLDWNYYPLTDHKSYKNRSVANDLVANVQVKYSFLNGFQLSALGQYQVQRGETESLAGIESYSTRNLINRFSQVNTQTGEVKPIVPMGGVMSRSQSVLSSYSGRAQLAYNNTIGRFDIAGILGMEIRQAKTGSNPYPDLYGYLEMPLSYQPIDLVNMYPTLVTGAMARIGGVATPNNMTNRFVSQFGNLALTYDTKYVWSVSARKDATNVFGLKANEKWNPLWSTGLAWHIHKENWIAQDWLSKLTLRTTLGYSGNLDPTKMAAIVISYQAPDNYYSFYPYSLISTPRNDNLRWEKTRMINLALDFGLLDNRIAGSFEWYNKRGTDLYGPTNYDYTTFGNAKTMIQNTANMAGNGIDLRLTTRNIGRKFKWNSSFIFSYNESKVTKYNSESANRLANLIGNGNVITPIEGHPLYSIASYRWGGLDAQGDPQGYTLEGISKNYPAIINEISLKNVADNIVIHGSSMPVFQGTFSNTFSYDRFSVSAMLSYRAGYFVRRSTFAFGSFLTRGDGHADFYKRWQNPGDELLTEVPALIYPNNENRERFYRMSEATASKADNIYLQYVSASYRWADHLGKRLNDGTVSINISNLGFVWRKDDREHIPNSATFSIGLKFGI